MNKSIVQIDDIKKMVLVNGIEIEVNVSFHVEPDDCEIDIEFETDEEKQEFYKKLNSGQIQNVFIQVIASYQGIIGADSLGGNLISSKNEILETIEEHGMTENACEELVKEIIQMSKDLKQFS